MSKAFKREDDSDDDAPAAAAPASPVRNLITSAGLERLRAELKELRTVERPKVVETVAWAASNGDRSENGDYIYGKRRLRQIDSRIHFLSERLKVAEPVDLAQQKNRD
jgi:transcription elongation factor GreB